LLGRPELDGGSGKTVTAGASRMRSVLRGNLRQQQIGQDSTPNVEK